MKPHVKIALGIFTSLATIGFIFFYDFYIKEKIDSVEVVVVKPGQEISKSEEIKEKNLTIERRNKETLVKGTVLASDINSILGYDAKYDLIGNEIISKKMVDFEQLVPNARKGEAVRPINKDMIFAEPGSLRRKDQIDIYIVKSNKSISFQQNVSLNKNNNDQTEPNKEGTITSGTINSEIGTKPFLKNVRVVYVKDNNNKEVISPEDSNNIDKRLDATSKISDIEIILNEEDFQKLMTEVIENGSKIYITYH